MNAAAASERKMAVREPLVVFAPYPPSANGIADYVGELMPYHRADFDVTLVIADDAVVPVEGRHTPRVLLASEFRRHRAFFANAPKLYHVGNNPDHCYMLDFLACDPGIVVLHDYNLNYMHEVATQGWKARNGYWPALQLEYGMIGKDALRPRFEARDRGQFATYELPLNGDVLEAATGIIAHARYVQYKVAARVPHKPVWYVPHHLSPAAGQYAQMTRSEARQHLGLPENEVIITAPGFITYAKRIPMLLSALSALRSRLPPFRLVLAGEKCPDQYDVDTDIAAAGLKHCTTCTGYLPEAEFFKHLAACDLVANLRHPTGGEMSGTLIRALGMGAPAVVFDIGPMGELPRSIVQKVSWGGDTHSALMAALQELISDKGRRQEMGARAASYVRETHNVQKIARRYAQIVRHCGEARPAAQQEIICEHFPHTRIVAEHVRKMAREKSPDTPLLVDGRVWWQCAKAPLGREGCRALLLVPNPAETAAFFIHAFGWRPQDVTAMTLEDFLKAELREQTGDPIGQAVFSFALVIAPATLAEISAATLLRRLNAALRRGGNLTLEIWSELDQENHDVALAEPRIPDRLADAGFAEASRVSRRHDGFFAEAVPAVSEGADSRRLVCFTARKASSMAFWRFMLELSGTPGQFGGRVGC
ncbi:MAG TPA: glycosyltransferase [Rhizomicrobium sp.]|jgi:glycosyltransferase involved in cell wall biosynthesis|nr:glycosyltransferase [Rhizomicrobium sp.]